MKTSRSASTAPALSADNAGYAEVAGGDLERGPNAPAASAAPPSGWMVLLRIFAYLVFLPAAILMLVRFLFQFIG